VDCARALLCFDASLALIQDDDGMTALHYVAGSRLDREVMYKLVNILTSSCNCVDLMDYSGATALIKASFYVKRPNGPFLIALLLEKGADPTIGKSCILFEIFECVLKRFVCFV
jgi:ankyrin repeat protein